MVPVPDVGNNFFVCVGRLVVVDDVYFLFFKRVLPVLGCIVVVLVVVVVVRVVVVQGCDHR